MLSGQNKREAASDAGSGFDFHTAFVEAGDLLYHGKSKAKAVFVSFVPRLIGHIETIPYLAHGLGIYAYSVVFYA